MPQVPLGALGSLTLHHTSPGSGRAPAFLPFPAEGTSPPLRPPGPPHELACPVPGGAVLRWPEHTAGHRGVSGWWPRPAPHWGLGSLLGACRGACPHHHPPLFVCPQGHQAEGERKPSPSPWGMLGPWGRGAEAAEAAPWAGGRGAEAPRRGVQDRGEGGFGPPGAAPHQAAGRSGPWGWLKKCGLGVLVSGGAGGTFWGHRAGRGEPRDAKASAFTHLRPPAPASGGDGRDGKLASRVKPAPPGVPAGAEGRSPASQGTSRSPWGQGASR